MTLSQTFIETDERRAFREQHLNTGQHFKNMKTFPVHYRPGRGSSSAHFAIDGYKTMDFHISELAPGSHNNKHRHINEAIIVIVCGRGHTMLTSPTGEEVRIDWGEGDIFSPPLNWWHQHFNDDPNNVARYMAATNVPLMEAMGVFVKEQWTE